ncbi:hypothetical protein NE848_08720 [Gramella jeungdoensis]|uniref:Uncharacterized protein n=1 Tax=Gramella jeungdoensis TaxID=708091 RepID=A0ABT0Z2J9_9FLAO|nr:hypothetical protein [Gramella jeungdoensis]MCM8569460.1 hypothetical protein [Gramella jeungdoensis]
MYFYLRLSVLFILFVIFLSCEADEVEEFIEEPGIEVADEPFILIEEYFRAKIDEEDWLVENQRSEFLNHEVEAEIYTWIDKDKNTFSALKVRASIEEGGKNMQAMGGFIQKYYGPGIYYIGTSRNHNYCHYFEHGVSWNSDAYRSDIGTIKIILDSGYHIEGIMNYRAFNANDPSKSKLINAEFSVYYKE